MKNIFKQFGSLHEVDEYIKVTPLNSVFRWVKLESNEADYADDDWHGTKNFESALKLMKNGWSNTATKLENKLSMIKNDIAVKSVAKSIYDVAGFQVSVPRTLQGLPTNMINKKMVPQKQKVITIVKNISYSSMVSADSIMENSMKALQIVKKIEAQGIRVNLDIMMPLKTSHETLTIRIRVKNANERLNVSKVAFPMVHPSMLRRIMFRLIESHPDVSDRDWIGGYGRPINGMLAEKYELKAFIGKGEYYLDSFIADIDEAIKNMKLD